jgi:hypothetical protein
MYATSAEVLGYHDEKVNLPSGERTNMRRRRNANRNRLKKGLNDAGKPTPIGQHTQGSYAMHTMVQDADSDYDIDDGVYFRKEKLAGPTGGELSALAVRQLVCDALRDDRFNTPPKVLKNCVRVYYNEGFHVDVPSYRRIESTDLWTGQTIYTYELASSDWKASDALEVIRWFRRRNRHHSPDFDHNDGQFCRIVRLLKMFARSRSSWKSLIATGFMITKLADESFVAADGCDDIALRETMKAIRGRLEWDKSIAHPTLNGEMITHADDARPGYFKDRLVENLNRLEVLDLADCTHADAMAAWDEIFCTDWFSQQPPPEEGDSGSGNARTSAAPSRPVEKRQGGRYAGWPTR